MKNLETLIGKEATDVITEEKYDLVLEFEDGSNLHVYSGKWHVETPD